MCYPLIIMQRRTVIVGVLAGALVAFLVWRFVRPMHIFVVHERFERPIPASTPAGLDTLRASGCRPCHAAIYQEWSQSMHAKAWSDPYFQVDFAFEDSPQICLNCHTPLEDQQKDRVLGFRDRGKFDPLLEPNPDYDPLLADEGVTCAVCHVRDGVIVGPFGSKGAPHPVAADPSMTSGMKPCEQCHVVTGERWDTFYRMPPCGTVAEIEERGQGPDCIGCHMPPVVRPAARGAPARPGRRHLFAGGHDPEQVKEALAVRYEAFPGGRYRFTLANVGAGHYLPTGTPDRHLTLELKLLDAQGKVLEEETRTMKRYVLWRPFIVDLRDTRLPFGVPRNYEFAFSDRKMRRAAALDVTVRYHLLDEARRRRIDYRNTGPIAYPVYHLRLPVKKRDREP